MSESFTTDIKKELCTKLTDRDKKYACLYGLLLFSHRFAYYDHKSFRTEFKGLADIFPSLVKNTFGDMPIQCETKLLQDGNVSYNFRFKPQDVETITREFNIHPNREIDLTKIGNNSMMSFISGAFLTCGSVSDPNKEYHMEFSLTQELLANDLLTVLESFGFNFKLSKRRNFNVLYVKGSESIEDILTFMGAENATLEMMNVKIFKSVQNRLNRRSNCEKANYTRSDIASQKQTEDISYIDSTIGIEHLPNNLIETAYVRMENPDMTLKELCNMFQKPIGRSGLSRRLQRLSNIAQQIRDGEYRE
jgi:hypothetical protein